MKKFQKGKIYYDEIDNENLVLPTWIIDKLLIGFRLKFRSLMLKNTEFRGDSQRMRF